MCLSFVLYYPRRPLADCRSLPTLQTLLWAFGIQELQGESFRKLELFLKDIGGSERKPNHLDFKYSLGEMLGSKGGTPALMAGMSLSGLDPSFSQLPSEGSGEDFGVIMSSYVT